MVIMMCLCLDVLHVLHRILLFTRITTTLIPHALTLRITRPRRSGPQPRAPSSCTKLCALLKSMCRENKSITIRQI